MKKKKILKMVHEKHRFCVRMMRSLWRTMDAQRRDGTSEGEKWRVAHHSLCAQISELRKDLARIQEENERSRRALEALTAKISEQTKRGPVYLSEPHD